jgi:hypothetical protein
MNHEQAGIINPSKEEQKMEIIQKQKEARARIIHADAHKKNNTHTIPPSAILEPPVGPGIYMYESPANTLNFDDVWQIYGEMDGFERVEQTFALRRPVFFVKFDTLDNVIDAVSKQPPGRVTLDGCRVVHLFLQTRQGPAEDQEDEKKRIVLDS